MTEHELKLAQKVIEVAHRVTRLRRDLADAERLQTLAIAKFDRLVKQERRATAKFDRLVKQE